MHFCNTAKALHLGDLGSVVELVILKHYDSTGKTILGGYMPVRQSGMAPPTAPPDIVIKNFIQVKESSVLSGGLIWEELCHAVGKHAHIVLGYCKFRVVNLPTSIDGIQKVSEWRIEESDGWNTCVARRMVIQDPASEVPLHGLVM